MNSTNARMHRLVGDEIFAEKREEKWPERVRVEAVEWKPQTGNSRRMTAGMPNAPGSRNASVAA